TSKYSTFSEKMKHITLAQAIRLSPAIRIFQLAAALQGDEFFEARELPASNASTHVIQLEAILEGNEWYERHVFPLVYEGYPLLGWMNIGRPDPNVLGIPPLRDVYIENAGSPYPYTNFSAAPAFSDEQLVYNLGQSVGSDFYDMQRHAVNYVADYPSRLTPRLESLVLSPLPHVRYGPYHIKFNYVIPGKNIVSSSCQVEIFNSIPDND
ncbi:MAG: hypothetical protein WA874_07265, partial [Chryseosolibacter sp.]